MTTIKTMAVPHIEALENLAKIMTEGARAQGYTGPAYDVHWLIDAYRHVESRGPGYDAARHLAWNDRGER